MANDDYHEPGLVSLKSRYGKYLTSFPDGKLDWNREWDTDWERFQIIPLHDGKAALRSYHGLYLSVEEPVDGVVRCGTRKVNEYATWTLEHVTGGMAFKSVFGTYLHPKADGTATTVRNTVTAEEVIIVTEHI
jgi:hypothetical protein